jgi:hypothetical protein
MPPIGPHWARFGGVGLFRREGREGFLNGAGYRLDPTPPRSWGPPAEGPAPPGRGAPAGERARPADPLDPDRCPPGRAPRARQGRRCPTPPRTARESAAQGLTPARDSAQDRASGRSEAARQRRTSLLPIGSAA